MNITPNGLETRIESVVKGLNAAGRQRASVERLAGLAGNALNDYMDYQGSSNPALKSNAELACQIVCEAARAGTILYLQLKSEVAQLTEIVQAAQATAQPAQGVLLSAEKNHLASLLKSALIEAEEGVMLSYFYRAVARHNVASLNAQSNKELPANLEKAIIAGMKDCREAYHAAQRLAELTAQPVAGPGCSEAMSTMYGVLTDASLTLAKSAQTAGEGFAVVAKNARILEIIEENERLGIEAYTKALSWYGYICRLQEEALKDGLEIQITERGPNILHEITDMKTKISDWQRVGLLQPRLRRLAEYCLSKIGSLEKTPQLQSSS